MRKLTLGSISDFSSLQARGWAVEQGRIFDQGLDPVHEKERNEAAERLRLERTCDWLFERYMDRVGNNQRSGYEKRRIYEHDIRPFIGARSYFDIKHDDLSVIIEHKFATAKTMSNRILSLIKAIFKWAVSRGRGLTNLTINPTVDLVNLAPSKRRKRFINSCELPYFLNALVNLDSKFGDGLIVIMYTGVRVGEAFGMRWSEVNLPKGEWVIPGSRTKNGEELLLPLPASVIDIIARALPNRRMQQELVWPSKISINNAMSGFSKITASLNADFRKLAQASGISPEHVRLHDMRRSVASGMCGLLDDQHQPLIPDHIVDRILNHKLPGLQSVYNRHSYYLEKKRALQIWADYIDALIGKL